MGLDGYNQLGTEKAFWLERDASMEEVIVGQEAEMMNLNFLKVSSNSLEISIIFQNLYKNYKNQIFLLTLNNYFKIRLL